MTRAPSLIDPIDDVLRRPPDEALMALPRRRPLPAHPIEQRWTPSRQAAPPAAGPLLQVDPSQPYVPGKATTLVFGAVWSHAGVVGEVFARRGTNAGIVYLYLSDLGPHRACVAWLDLRVAHPPTSTLTIGATTTRRRCSSRTRPAAASASRCRSPSPRQRAARRPSTSCRPGPRSGAYWHAASIHGL